jgi:hypothetical protein
MQPKQPRRAQSAGGPEQALYGLYPRTSQRQKFAKLRKIIFAPGKMVVDCICNGAREQENIRDHLRLLPTLVDALQLVQFFGEAMHHFPDGRKGV